MRIDVYCCSVIMGILGICHLVAPTANAQSSVETQAVAETQADAATQTVAENRALGETQASSQSSADAAPPQTGRAEMLGVPRPDPIDPSDSQPVAVDAKTLDRLHAPLLRNDLKVLGATSCATSNCHAGPRPGVLDLTARRSMEYQAWIENDPHSQSWRTICSDESIDMMTRLGILQGDRIVDRAGFDNCLACHNSLRRFDEPRYISQSTESVNDTLREGVGCSACHGPSEKWVNVHFQSGWTPEASIADGFVETGDLYTRARMCASCHVGDKDRDMNHDIIAAGHPTLRYELATFHAWQPKHWRDDESADKTAYEAQLWLAGQIAAADASLSLLQTRAESAHSVSEWPEFAAYNCASCHHHLGLDNDRQAVSPSRRGVAIYSQWNDSGLRWLIEFRINSGSSTIEDTQLLASLDRVQREMERRPLPQPETVSLAAAEARQSLARWFESAPGQEERSRFRSDRLGRVLADAAGRTKTFQSWESASQFYLALVAARESWPGGWKGPMRQVADQMQYGLQYPQMIDISRFAKRPRARGPQSSRLQVMAMGIELASVLGPVDIEPFAMTQDDDPAEVRIRLKRLIEEVNQEWEPRRVEFEKRQREARDRAKEEGDREKPEQDPPKTIDQLMEERNRARNSSNEPKE